MATPSLPAASTTFSCSVSLPDRTTPSHDRVVPATLAVMSLQVAPLSSEPYTMSPAASGADSVALTVCAAVLVIRSVLLGPVSADSATPLKPTVGAVVSSTYACV